jgi:hypothetical protein
LKGELVKLDILKTAVIAVEAVVIATCAFAATQIATSQGGSIWLCAPILVIAAMESLRLPVAMHIPKLRFVGAVLAVALLVGLTPLTFEGMVLAFEQFMNQRVLTVAAAQTRADEAQVALDGANQAGARRADELARLNQEVKDAEDRLGEIARQKPDIEAQPPSKTCPTYGWIGKGKVVRWAVIGSHECDNGIGKSIADANRDARKAYDARLTTAQDEVKKARDELRSTETAPGPDQPKIAADLQKAKGDLEVAKATSVMHRAAAAWFGIDVGKLTPEQFETFKKWAMYGLAGATATVTMIAGFVSSLSRKDGRPSKVGMAWRAYLARRRKKLVRIVEKVRPGPTLKTLTVKYVPFDPVSGRVINADGSKGEEVRKGA